MAEEKKSLRKQLNKVFIVGAVVFAVVFTILGINAIKQSKEAGSDKIIQNEESLNSLIHRNQTSEGQTVSLTDEQFLEGLNKVFPQDGTLESDIRISTANIEKTLSQEGIVADVRYFNNFGTAGYCIATQVSLEEVKALLDFSLCPEYYVQIADSSGIGLTSVYKVTKDSTEARLISGKDVGVQQDNTLIADLCSNLEEQYNITNVVLTDKALIVYSTDVSTADLLNVFDYTYQWCLQNDCDRQLFIYSSDLLVAVSDETLRDEYYSSNYPIDELAAVFRLKYYTAKCFFSTSMQTICNLYL